MQDTTNAIMKLIELLPEPFRASALAAMVAFVRVMYDGKEPRLMRRVLESVLCGLIALSIAYMIEALGMSVIGPHSSAVRLAYSVQIRCAHGAVSLQKRKWLSDGPQHPPDQETREVRRSAL